MLEGQISLGPAHADKGFACEGAPGRRNWARARAQIEREQARAFVVFQLIFWGANLAVRTLAAAQARPEFTLDYLPNRVLIVAVGAVLTTAIHAVLLRTQKWSSFQRLMLGLCLCILAIAPMHALEVTLAQSHGALKRTVTFIDYLSQFGWVFLMWAGYYFALERAFHLRLQAISLAQISEAQHQAEMKMLRYQLNPHFIFNSLNAVSALVLERRNADAEAMILRLARFLRHTIDTDPMQFARLDSEFAIQELYIGIEAARFGERLQVCFDLPEQLQDCLAPSMLLQPVLENAVKHGIAGRPGGGRIRVRAETVEGAASAVLRLSVEDDGPGVDPVPKSMFAGVGLRNTRDRMARLFGARGRMSFDRSELGGLRVTIDLPLMRAV